MKNKKTTKLVLAALFTAFTCVTTMIHPFQGAIGYIHFGDAFVLLGVFFLGPLWGGAAAGIGSMLADILAGFAPFAPGTLVIKFLMAFAAGLIYKSFSAKGKTVLPALLCGICGEAIMIAGYFVYECFIWDIAAAVAEIPLNIVQAGFGLVLSVVLLEALSKVPYVKQFLRS